jgi:hypothetical protein
MENSLLLAAIIFPVAAAIHFLSVPPPPSIPIAQASINQQSTPTPVSSTNLRDLSDQDLTSRIASDYGLRRTPTIVEACTVETQSNFSGLASSKKWTMYLCKKDWVAGQREITIAHELGHFRDYEQGLVPTEESADKHAVDWLAKQGLWESVRLKAEDTGNNPEYFPGTVYAREKLKEASSALSTPQGVQVSQPPVQSSQGAVSIFDQLEAVRKGRQ